MIRPIRQMLAFWLPYQVVKHIHLLSMVLLKSKWISETKYSIKDGSDLGIFAKKTCFNLSALKSSCATFVAETQWENCTLEVIMKSEHL